MVELKLEGCDPFGGGGDARKVGGICCSGIERQHGLEAHKDRPDDPSEVEFQLVLDSRTLQF